MADIKIGNDFQIFSNGKMEITQNNDIQKFMTLLTFPKTSLFWDEIFGTDFNFLLDISRLDNFDAMRAYYISQANDLSVDLYNISFAYTANGTLETTFYFQGETVTVEQIAGRLINARVSNERRDRHGKRI